MNNIFTNTLCFFWHYVITLTHPLEKVCLVYRESKIITIPLPVSNLISSFFINDKCVVFMQIFFLVNYRFRSPGIRADHAILVPGIRNAARAAQQAWPHPAAIPAARKGSSPMCSCSLSFSCTQALCKARRSRACLFCERPFGTASCKKSSSLTLTTPSRR